MSLKDAENEETVEKIFTGYGPKTLVSGWNYTSESYPRDVKPSEQYQAISTYKRLGALNIPTPSTTTRSSQEMALRMPRPTRSYRPMVNLITYPYLFNENRMKIVDKVGLKPPPPCYGCTDYLTTNQYSYKNLVEGPMTLSYTTRESYQPETKYRRVLTDPYNMKRPNLGTFLDDNLDCLSSFKKPEYKPPPYGLHYQPKWTWEMHNQK